MFPIFYSGKGQHNRERYSFAIYFYMSDCIGAFPLIDTNSTSMSYDLLYEGTCSGNADVIYRSLYLSEQAFNSSSTIGDKFANSSNYIGFFMKFGPFSKLTGTSSRDAGSLQCHVLNSRYKDDGQSIHTILNVQNLFSDGSGSYNDLYNLCINGTFNIPIGHEMVIYYYRTVWNASYKLYGIK